MTTIKSTELLVLIGLPGSGKSFFAKNFIAKNENWTRINRDDLRLSIFNTPTPSSDDEDLITKIQDFMIKSALKEGKSVVVDNMNLEEKYRKSLLNIAESVGNVLYKEKIIDTSLQDCVANNNTRDKPVPVDLIEKLAKKYKNTLWGNYKANIVFCPKIEVSSVVNQDPTKQRAIMVDLDGTMAIIHKDRSPYDASTCDQDLPNIPVIETVKALNDAGYHVIFCSGREDKYREPTRKFLDTHFIALQPKWGIDGSVIFVDNPRQYELFMRQTGDNRKDSIVKEEIFNSHIKNNYNILCVLDDRQQVVDKWRELGLTCFQVNYGDF